MGTWREWGFGTALRTLEFSQSCHVVFELSLVSGMARPVWCKLPLWRLDVLILGFGFV